VGAAADTHGGGAAPGSGGTGCFRSPNLDTEARMPISIEEIVERAFEQAFSRALDQTLQTKAEELFRKAFQEGSPLAKKLEEKIEQGFERFVTNGIQWEKKRAGFRK